MIGQNELVVNGYRVAVVYPKKGGDMELHLTSCFEKSYSVEEIKNIAVALMNCDSEEVHMKSGYNSIVVFKKSKKDALD